MQTIKAFAAQSHISETLIRAVVRQSGGWDSFREDAPNICQHGVNGGYSGWIYYTETVPFATQYRSEILGLVKDLASDLGENWLDVLAGFNCLDMTTDEIADVLAGLDDDNTQLYNALAWFAAEEVARSYCDSTEEF